MNSTYPTALTLPVASFPTEQSRQLLIKAVISFKQGAYQVTDPLQRQLLEQFVQGRLTIDEVVYYLETTVTGKA